MDDSSAGSHNGGNIRLILSVPDPDFFFQRVLGAGAKEVFPVTEEHGWRTGRLIDPYGIHWEICKEVTGG